MALVGQNQQTTFSNPQNGQAPDADVVRGNDNALVAKHNAHDADATIHTQTGLLSARPAAGTAGAVYIDENKRIYVDNGTAWAEVPYARLDAAGTNTFTNNVSIGGTFDVAGASTVGDVDAGAVTATSVTASGAVGAASAAISGTVTATTFSGSGASLTNLPAANLTGTLPAISGANLTSLNASNISSGTLSDSRLPTTMGGKTLTSVTIGDSATTFKIGDAATVLEPRAASGPAYYYGWGSIGPVLPDGWTPQAFGGSDAGGTVAANSWRWMRVEGPTGSGITLLVPCVVAIP